MKKIFFCLVLALASMVILSAEDAGITSFDWPRFRGENQDGIYTEGDFNAKKLSVDSVLWKKNVGTGYSAPTIVGSRLFIIGYESSDDVIRCLNTETGAELWDFSYKSWTDREYPGSRSSPTYYEGKIYSLGRGGDLYCLDADSGREVWHSDLEDLGGRNLRWSFAGSVYVSGDLAVVNASESGIAFNKDTGEVVWKSRNGLGGYATPVPFVFNGKDYLAIFGQNHLYGVDFQTGEVLWSLKWRTGYDVNAGDPLIFDDKLFVSTGYGVGCGMFDISSGSPVELWKNRNVASHFHSSIYYKERIFAPNGDAGNSRGAAFRCINPSDGSIAWEQRLGFSGFILADDKFILCNESGQVYIFEASTTAYREIATAKFDSGQYWTAPVLSRGLLYIRTSQGLLTCIDLR